MTAQTCPRRVAEPGPWEHGEGLDRWTSGHGLVTQDTVGLSCSFCGSLHPDRFMELIRDGWLIGPTDKSYKAYLARPYTADEAAARKRRWLEVDAVAKAVRKAFAEAGKTPEETDAELEPHWREHAVIVEGATLAKFYYQHLSDVQRTEFVDLANSGQARFSYPGYLYVLPFFCRRVAADQKADTTP